MELKIQSLGNIQEQEEEEEEKEKEEEEEEEKHFHVLAVDDNVLDRKILERLLRISSYKVTCVESGDKALEYLGLLDNLQAPSPSSSSSSSSATCSPSSSPQLSNVEPQPQGLKVNLIMTDFCMPGINGYDLLKIIKGSAWNDVPVIVMSSENVPARVTMCLEGGAEEFLLKPLQLSDLEKLQPLLLKSLNHPTPPQTGAAAEKDDDAVAVKSKRKAMSPKPSDPDRRPKMKELAVV